MYRWFRNIHLWLGLLAFPMLMMYGISSIGMAHHAWFSGKPQVSERVAKLALSPGTDDGRGIARELMVECGVRGVLSEVRPTPDGYHLAMENLGTTYEADYTNQTQEAKIRTTTGTFMGMLNRLHHVKGFRSPSQAVDLVGGLVLLASLTLILLGLTGIYLWFQFHEERKIGAVLLGLSLAYSLTLMILIRAA